MNNTTKNQPRERLVAERKKTGLTQEQTAKAAGISYRYYQCIEAGASTPNVETAISIAELLKCDVSDLFSQRRQPCESDTQSHYTASSVCGLDEAKELHEATKDFDVSVEMIVDIAEDGRLDSPEYREQARRLSKALAAALD